MQILGGKVGAVVPSKRMALESELFEVISVAKRLKYRPPKNTSKIGLAIGAVIEP